MGKKQMSWKTRGMNRDLSVSAFNPEFAFENRNLRLSTNENNTMLSWVNEKGTEEVKVQARCYKRVGADKVWQNEVSINGQVIGTAVLNHQLILFTHGEGENGFNDRIYSLRVVDSAGTSLAGTVLFYGNLNFAIENPIETLVSYESENIQKVYWTDKRNQPRVINIAAEDATLIKWSRDRMDGDSSTITTFFDFVRTLKLNEEVYVKKITGASGMFPAGVLQYAFTYFDQNGQESNIFYTSPLLYTSHKDRGGSPEDKVDNVFRIKIKSVDTDFDFVRIYSIMRTSVNGTPICKRVQDVSTKNIKNGTITFLDTGTIGDVIDPTELLYKGGEEIIAGTMEQKDGTLFFGNIGITRKPISDFESAVQNNIVNFSSDYRTIYPDVISTKEIYPYSNQLTSYSDIIDSGSDETITTLPCGGFKRGETYRLGVQFQYKTGKWSDPIYYRDAEEGLAPEETNANGVKIPIFTGSLSSTVVNSLLNAGYKKVRGVCVYPSVQDRRILCQGVVNQTLCTANHKYSINEYEQAAEYNSGTTTPAGHQGQRGIRRRRVPSDAPSVTWTEGDLHAQSDWFFRSAANDIEADSEYSPGENRSGFHPIDEGYNPSYDSSRNYLLYTDYERNTSYSYSTIRDNIRSVEIQGAYNIGDCFYTDNDFVTFHSPDIEFDTQLQISGFDNTQYMQVGHSSFLRTLSDIDIQTDSATVSSSALGFVHRSFNKEGNKGIVSGLFWSDFIVDDDANESGDIKFQPYDQEAVSVLWMVYLWNRSGSLNNDTSRPANSGEQSAVLNKKIVSNLRVTSTKLYNEITQSRLNFSKSPKLYNSDDATMIKFGEEIYKGNIDEILIPGEGSPIYFAGGNYTKTNGSTQYIASGFLKRATQSVTNIEAKGPYFNSDIDMRLRNFDPNNLSDEITTTMQAWDYLDTVAPGWKDLTVDSGDNIGDKVSSLAISKDPVHLKYKSTPHLAFKPNKTNTDVTGGIAWESTNYGDYGALPIIEITQNPIMPYGGNKDNPEILQAHSWIPCGEPTTLSSGNQATIKWEYGDTYYQRWDCLKTYAYTPEDENQVVEIGSFMLETRVNIAGRYDKNRGQISNLYINPQNFNLLNPVYTQQDNFFTYKILGKSFYENNAYPNQITWSKTKTSGADVDQWTNVTLANNLELDGDKGSITKLVRLNNQLFTFQDTGISQILYNERVQVSSTEGVPIEIANSNKVDGKRYISNTVGCSNKWSISISPMGVYFIDSNEKSIYLFNGQLNNLSTAAGFNTWCKNNIPAPNIVWNPLSFGNYVSYYDKLNQDVLFINNSTALAYSEKIGAFTSFYDYGGASFFCNLDDTGLWIKDYTDPIEETTNSKIWLHQGGEYCNFFGEQKSYGMILIGNPEPLTDKIFTNLEFRACVDGEGEFRIVDEGTENEHREFSSNFFLPFDYLETWNEYQHGLANLSYKNGTETMRHHLNNKSAHLARKFRIWRCDIPRDNMQAVDVFDYTFNKTFHQPKEIKKIDRMRNPWLYIKLKKDSDTDKRVEIHDMVMTYYN